MNVHVVLRYDILFTVSLQIKVHRQFDKILIKRHFFGLKVHFLGLFKAKIWKIENIQPLKNPQIIIERQPFSSVDKVVSNEI